MLLFEVLVIARWLESTQRLMTTPCLPYLGGDELTPIDNLLSQRVALRHHCRKHIFMVQNKNTIKKCSLNKDLFSA